MNLKLNCEEMAALSAVVRNYWPDELAGFVAQNADERHYHIFNRLVLLDNKLNGTGHKPEDYLAFKCQNCGGHFREDELKDPIPDLEQRVAPGEPMPAGECPDCGALCHAAAVKD